LQFPVPQFVGGWEPAKQNPKVLSEAQGAVIGHHWVIFGGFDTGYDQATADTYALDLDDPNAEWVKQDDYPLAPGITHAANVVVDSKLYVCGGYLGGHPGPHVEQCFVFDFTISAGTTGQWSSLSDLPAGRGGGGLTYDTTLNTLTYAGGAERPNAGVTFFPILDYFTRVYTIDYRHAWTLDLNDMAAGWVERPDIPYDGNHMGFVTALDKDMEEHHYYLGGQLGEDEFLSNLDSNYEWDAGEGSWTARARLPFKRGHASESTRPISCGFIQAGGATNILSLTPNLLASISDISYYDIETNSWVKIGDLPVNAKTPVCVIHQEYMYCEAAFPYEYGLNGERFCFRRKIIVP